MATLNINILNPIIDLISNNTGVSNSCKTVYTFDIISIKDSNITVTADRVNPTVEDYDKLEYDNGAGFVTATASQTFIMNSSGAARYRVTIGNVELLDAKYPNTIGSNCNKTKVTVADNTNNESEIIELSRCINDDRCTVAAPPAPVDPEIDAQTNIRIYFDASGSMNTTLAPLQTMRDTLLRDVLLPYYNNDVTLYNSKVKILEVAFGTPHAPVYEDPFGMLNYENQNIAGKVISLVFMDEADIFAVAPFDVNDPPNVNHVNSLATFRNRLNNFPVNYYKGVLFQIATPDVGGDMIAFRAYIDAVKNGTGSYAGTSGLSDKSEVSIKLDIPPADTAQNYTDLVVTSLNEFGFNL